MSPKLLRDCEIKLFSPAKVELPWKNMQLEDNIHK